jgi:NADH dehydrogenase
MSFRLAVTGANGFVGRHLVRQAAARGHEVVGIVRSEAARKAVVEDGGRPALVDGLSEAALLPALAGCRALVHLAHVGSERGGATYESVNVAGTAAAAAAARAAGVGRIACFSGLGVAHFGQWPRSTNRYFQSKLEAELHLYRSGLEAVVFRPSYVVGPGETFVPSLLREMAEGEVTRIGDGAYRMQPVFVRDAADLVLAALEAPPHPSMHGGTPAPRVYDLVGPEPLSYDALVGRLARVARTLGRPADFRIREVPIAQADAEARAGGFRGMAPDELDCVLCDEVGDPRPLEALLGRFLAPLDEALASVVRTA